MADKFAGQKPGMAGPIDSGEAINPGAAALPHATRAIYVGGAGDVTVTMVGNGGSVTFTGVSSGTVLPVRASHVTAATASNLLALW